MVAEIAIIERKPLPPDIQERVFQAVQRYLDSLPHAPQAWRNYKRLKAMNPSDASSNDIHAAVIWSLIERQAEEVAQREIDAAFRGQTVRIEFKLEGPITGRV